MYIYTLKNISSLTGHFDDDEGAEEALPDQERRGNEAQRERVARVAEAGGDRRDERPEFLDRCLFQSRRRLCFRRPRILGLRPARAGAARRGGHSKGYWLPRLEGEQAGSR